MKLFELDARSPDAGGELWSGFRRVGSPTLRLMGGQYAVFFDGKGDTYEHAAPAALCGAHARTIEVWAFKESVRGDEETLVAWGRRGGPTASNLALNWGNNGAYGGATHWAADMGWHGTPRAGQWHHLVYTYDGKTARLYDNGAEKASMDIRLVTPQSFPIRLAVQNAANGTPAFKNEYNGSAMSGPVGIALLRLHDSALTETEVQAAFKADQERFKAVAPLTLASLREGGVTKVSAGGLTLTVSKSENKPLGLVADATGFDFLPTDRLLTRLGDGFHHLGDVLVRASGPVETKTQWLAERGQLVLRATVTNTGSSAVELGAVGFPVIFNNIISDRDLPQAHEKCVFFDPYIGQDAGYLRVTRLSGAGPALAVIPDGKTPFEAYQPLREPIGPSQTFEGAYAWLAHSAAYAEKDWGKATPWNVPTKATLAPGESRTYGLRFVLAESIRGLEKAIAAAGRPVAVGVPGYIVPQSSDAKLILNYSKPVKSMTVEPAGALALTPAGKTPAGGATYAVKATGWGRARLTLTYADGLTQTVHYWLTKPAAQAVASLGEFLFTKQWYEKPNDPFGRSPSVMSYDRELNQIVEQDSRAWIAGLGDEGGSSWLTAAMKLFLQPDPAQVAKFERFVDGVLWGNLQFSSGPNKYGVRKTTFFYDPKVLPDFPYRKDINWGSWTSWNKRTSDDVGRGFNYPHVVAAYWSLYRIARNTPGMTKRHDWKWYLEQAFQTTKFLFSGRVGYAELGLMEGTVFLRLLKDLQAEGWTAQASELEALTKKRADKWRQEAYPFGSEMAWDSTGQEEVYAWTKHFGYDDKATVSVNSILGYMQPIPHWGYNSNARRYWDFLYGGKLPRIERQLHHYGSGMNALPVLAEFRSHPDDTYLLRIGYGGMMAPLSNIDQGGFASAAFHSNPDTLRWDYYSGDYGPGFLGHALNTGCYIVNDPELGWQAFGGALTQRGTTITVTPQDSLRQRVFIAPLKLWLVLDAGQFERVTLDTKTKAVTLTFPPKTEHAPVARLRIEGQHKPTPKLPTERGAVVIELGARGRTINLINI
ncbi:DUF5695 domain-containing protein [Armatimonas rosea]|uniref:LamG-like jellyroll fold domain-containing protein n=1 Tax=Armatimonas rosea TaxID=685828 RepID=A0A7W9SVI3_ARMRO|nr:DUF5695 domain-containing protein [Armatimonas rosea]MBB6053153.1 hypothetical protein [Armatimonas rosea]